VHKEVGVLSGGRRAVGGRRAKIRCTSSNTRDRILTGEAGMSVFERVGYDIEVVRNAGKANRPRSVPHYHNAFEITYYWRGGVDFFVRDQTYTARPGDVIFVNTFEIHNRVANDKFTEKTLIIFSPSFLESVSGVPDVFAILDGELGGCRHITLPDALREDTERFLRAMATAYLGAGTYASVCLRAYLILFLTSIAEYLGTLKKRNSRSVGYNARLRDLIQFIKENLDTRLTLSTICRYFRTDKFYLCRYFKKHTGLSVMEYVNRMRIVNAEKLIVQNRHSITDIGLMIGFSNITNFDRTFKRYTGISPREYRRNTIHTSTRMSALESARSVQSAER
jgi:AraC-like DNA-binding protein/quercetin dioxygenase-like cupin family protein